MGESHTASDEIVQASMEAWNIFIQTGIESEFFRETCSDLGRDWAARMTLMHLYLQTFGEEEQRRLMEDVDFFLRYAVGCFRALVPPADRPD